MYVSIGRLRRMKLIGRYKMFHSEIAGNYHLYITDFAEDDDVEGIEQMWNQNIERLHVITGM